MTATQLITDEFSMDDLAARLTALGVPCFVEMTGGGVATIYGGATWQEPGWGTRHSLVAGPGWFDSPSTAVGSVVEFCYGPDNETGDNVTYVTGPLSMDDLAQQMADWAKRERIHATSGDDWQCLCGNAPHLDGFYPYSDGREVAPDDAAWDGVQYFCASCFRIIDQNTLEIVERRDSVALLEEMGRA